MAKSLAVSEAWMKAAGAEGGLVPGQARGVDLVVVVQGAPPSPAEGGCGHGGETLGEGVCRHHVYGAGAGVGGLRADGGVKTRAGHKGPRVLPWGKAE